MELIKLDGDFSVCKLSDLKEVDLTREFTFVSKTDDELSLVCPSQYLPEHKLEVEHDWKALKISGILDFSMIGVIAGISNLLAAEKISIFVISTFNTDYILIKSERFNQSLKILQNNGYQII